MQFFSLMLAAAFAAVVVADDNACNNSALQIRIASTQAVMAITAQTSTDLDLRCPSRFASLLMVIDRINWTLEDLLWPRNALILEKRSRESVSINSKV
ncbi:hypothetical protein N7488_008601 [Penicillium malachiteum]|nr:hypothetical protein N7488_008601 [Penicillium malachiteum]